MIQYYLIIILVYILQVSCAVLDEEDIPLSDYASKQTYLLPYEPMFVWLSVLEEYSLIKDRQLVTYSREDYLLSWTTKASKRDCIDSSAYSSVITLTTIHIKPYSQTSRLFIRRICYDYNKNESIVPGYASSGSFERNFIDKIQQRLKGY